MTNESPDQIRKKGFEALAAALGPVGMVRFLQQFDMGKEDYTKDRKNWLGKLSVDEVAKHIKED